MQFFIENVDGEDYQRLRNAQIVASHLLETCPKQNK